MKKVIKIVIEVICYIIVISFTLFILYALYIIKRPINMNFCGAYGPIYKEIKVGKRHYCCAKTEDEDYKGCIKMNDD